jgi:hypothetical protein
MVQSPEIVVATWKAAKQTVMPITQQHTVCLYSLQN